MANGLTLAGGVVYRPPASDAVNFSFRGATRKAETTLNFGAFVADAASGGYAVGLVDATAARVRVAMLARGAHVVSGFYVRAGRLTSVDLDVGSYGLAGADVILSSGQWTTLTTGIHEIAGSPIDIARVLRANVVVGRVTIAAPAPQARIVRDAQFEVGAYALAGMSIDVRSGVLPVAMPDRGAIVIAGADLTVLRHRIAALGAGSLTLDGGAARAIRPVTATGGLMNISGVAIVAHRMFLANLPTIQMASTGADAPMARVVRLAALPTGVYGISGVLKAHATRVAAIAPGGYVVTPRDMRAHVAHRLVSGALSTTGSPVTAFRRVAALLATGNIVVSGSTATGLVHRAATLRAGRVLIAGRWTSIRRLRGITATTGSCIVSGRQIASVHLRSPLLASGGIAIEGQEAGVIHKRLALCGSGSYTVMGGDAARGGASAITAVHLTTAISVSWLSPIAFVAGDVLTPGGGASLGALETTIRIEGA